MIVRYYKEKEKNNIPESSSNLVVNILNDDLSLNEERATVAINQVDIITLAEKLQKAKGGIMSEHLQELKAIVDKKGIRTEDMKNSGCMFLLAIASTITLSLIVAACSFI